MSVIDILQNEHWETACHINQLVPNSGVCALLQGEQIALFYLPDGSPSVYAVNNWDPVGKANVMSRGIVGSIGDELVVASPLHKQHFSLASGACLEDSNKVLASYATKVVDGNVQVSIHRG